MEQTPAAKTDSVRRKILYSGRVQGVGFRYTTRSLASGFAVVGSVRNLADGSVELVAEGKETEIAAFLRAIQAELGHCIRQVDEQPLSGGGPFKGFEIRY